jgi:arylsulfatase A-like enzyme
MTAVAGVAALALAASTPAGPPGVVIFVADDWSADFAGAYGDPSTRTPAFDRLGREGVLFRSAFATAPVCAPSRASLLTGRPPHALGEAASQWGRFPDSVATYPEMLLAAGWAAGHVGKGWGPGPLAGGALDPAGPAFQDLAAFLADAAADRPFHVWVGSRRPHRPFRPEGALRAPGAPDVGFRPPHLPDLPEIRDDLAEYGRQVEALDRELRDVLRALARDGRDARTTVVVTSDQGMPFPRAKADVYDAGVRVPLLFRPPEAVRPGAVVESLADLSDVAPTLLGIAGLPAPPGAAGSDLGAVLRGERDAVRDAVFVERERHNAARPGLLGYPVRAVRTREHLYVLNLRSDRGPAGEPTFPAPDAGYADVDPSPTKDRLLRGADDPALATAFARAFARRPAEELYDVARDPGQLRDLARDVEFAAVRDALRARLAAWMEAHGDPRAAELGSGAPPPPSQDPWDAAPYRGPDAPRSGGDPE